MSGSDLIGLLVAIVLVALFLYVMQAVFVVVLIGGAVIFVAQGLVWLVRQCAGSKRKAEQSKPKV